MSDECKTCGEMPDCGDENSLFELYSLQDQFFFVLNCPESNCSGAYALFIACCDGNIPVVFPNGATLAQKLSLIQQAAKACLRRAAFCASGSIPTPTPGQPINLYYNNTTQVTVYCNDQARTPFTFTLRAGTFLGFTQAAANAAALVYAKEQAELHKICLSDLPPAICYGGVCSATSVTLTVKAHGNFLANFPFSDWWEISSGTIPTGMTFNGGYITGKPNQATITGIPTTPGVYTFTVKVVSGSPNVGLGDYAFKTYTVAVLGITSYCLPSTQLGVPYSFQLEAAGTVGEQGWTISAGTLPDGLSLDPLSGIISGIPTNTEDINVTICLTAENAPGVQCCKAFGPCCTGATSDSWDLPDPANAINVTGVAVDQRCIPLYISCIDRMIFTPNNHALGIFGVTNFNGTPAVERYIASPFGGNTFRMTQAIAYDPQTNKIVAMVRDLTAALTYITFFNPTTGYLSKIALDPAYNIGNNTAQVICGENNRIAISEKKSSTTQMFLVDPVAETILTDADASTPASYEVAINPMLAIRSNSTLAVPFRHSTLSNTSFLIKFFNDTTLALQSTLTVTGWTSGCSLDFISYIVSTNKIWAYGLTNTNSVLHEIDLSTGVATVILNIPFTTVNAFGTFPPYYNTFLDCYILPTFRDPASDGSHPNLMRFYNVHTGELIGSIGTASWNNNLFLEKMAFDDATGNIYAVTNSTTSFQQTLLFPEF